MITPEAFLRQLRQKNYSESTLRLYRDVLSQFDKFTPESIDAYQKKTGPLALNTKKTYLHKLRCFLDQAYPELSGKVIIPKGSQRLPKDIPSQQETRQILSKPDISTSLGIRNKALLEVLYATGLRKSECSRLELDHIDWGRQMIRVRQGKGGKDRVIPIAKTALHWVRRYLEGVRPRCQEKTVFVSCQGRPLGSKTLHRIVKKYGPFSCHKYRHGFATHLLQNGMKETSLQTLLGHSKITTTQLYTQVTIEELKKSYKKAHPRDRWKM